MLSYSQTYTSTTPVDVITFQYEEPSVALIPHPNVSLTQIPEEFLIGGTPRSKINFGIACKVCLAPSSKSTFPFILWMICIAVIILCTSHTFFDTSPISS